MSTAFNLVPTTNFAAFGFFATESTYYILINAFRFVSSIFWKKFCSSFPLKNLIISFQSGGVSNYPKFGFMFPDKILRAVDLPVPFDPTSPSTSPALGVGSLCNLKLLAPYL